MWISLRWTKVSVSFLLFPGSQYGPYLDYRQILPLKLRCRYLHFFWGLHLIWFSLMRAYFFTSEWYLHFSKGNVFRYSCKYFGHFKKGSSPLRLGLSLAWEFCFVTIALSPIQLPVVRSKGCPPLVSCPLNVQDLRNSNIAFPPPFPQHIDKRQLRFP